MSPHPGPGTGEPSGQGWGTPQPGPQAGYTWTGYAKGGTPLVISVRFLRVFNGCSAWRALGTAKTVTPVP